jgi:thiol-disulfide isomerase/thioredoxin
MPSKAVLLALAALSISNAGAGHANPAGPDARIADRLRGRELAAQLPPLDRPTHKAAAAATHMRDDDWVLGVVVAGRACAYPWWVIKNYHVVNDVIGGVPVAVAFCEQCSGGAAFRRERKGRVLGMAVAGVYNGTIVLKDRETGTLWAPFSGRALEGPLVDEKLERLPVALAHWDEWTTRHPKTEVIWAEPSARGGHGSWYRPGKWGIVTEMGSTLETWDPRLPENTMVYGVESGTSAKSYPLARVGARQGVVNDEVGGTPVVVVARGDLEAAGFDRRLGGRVLTFRPAAEPGAAMADAETGSLWSLDGDAISGALRGQRLAPLDGYMVEWHVWSAYNPRADVLAERGSDDPPALPQGLSFPELTLPEMAGDRPRSLPLDGEVNVVALWAAWCPPCRAEMPLIQALVQKHAAAGLAAVGIAIHIPEPIEREAVRTFVGEARITFPTFLVDEAGYDQLEALATRLGGSGLVIPTVFVTDKRGKVTAVFRGKDVERAAGAVEALLAHGRP